MKLYFDQLAGNLAQKLQAVYLLAGEELLLVQESRQAIRNAANQQGFTESLKFHVDSGFDWQQFHQAWCSSSLLGDKQHIELKLNSLKLSEAAKTMLLNAIERRREDKLLVLILPKLDSNAQKNVLVKACETHGAVVNIWPLQGPQLQNWLKQRLQQAGFQLDTEGMQLLLTNTQGNLFAAAQEIEKLALIYPPGKLSLKQLTAVSNDHARFDLFTWVDTLLQGQIAHSLRILHSFKEEGEEPVLILWALTRELRSLIRLAELRSSGKTLDQVLQSPGIWEKRKPILKRCLQQHNLSSLQNCLAQAARIDRLIKGAAKGSVWNDIERLSLGIGGLPC